MRTKRFAPLAGSALLFTAAASAGTALIDDETSKQPRVVQYASNASLQPTVISSTQSLSAPQTGALDVETVVMAVDDLLDGGVGADDLIDVIEVALSLQDDTAAISARFHEATGLILARGTHEQMSAVRDVIRELRESRTRSRQRDESRVMTRQLESNIADLSQQVAMQQAMADDLARQRVEMETRANMLAMQADETTARLRDREEAIMQLRAELQDARSVIADLQRQIASMESERRAKKSGTGGR